MTTFVKLPLETGSCPRVPKGAEPKLGVYTFCFRLLRGR